MARSVLIERESTPIGGFGQYFSEVFYFPPTWFDRNTPELLGYVNADEAGDLAIWQGSYQSDVSGVIVVPGATLVLVVANPGTGVGVGVREIVSAPWVRFVYTNGKFPQSIFRLEIRALR